jgi:hypothetical protein
MYILCLFEAVFISLVLTLGKKGLECFKAKIHQPKRMVRYLERDQGYLRRKGSYAIILLLFVFLYAGKAGGGGGIGVGL